MAIFVPSSNGWGSGLASLADAFAQAPMNRARVRQMELDAANQAAQTARAEAELRIRREEAARDAQLHPGRVSLQQGQITGQNLQNRGYEQDYRFNEQNNPLILRKSGADAQTAETGARVAQRREGAYDPLMGAAADQVMTNLADAVVPKLRGPAMLQDAPTPEGDSAISALLGRARLANEVDAVRPRVEGLSQSLIFQDQPDPNKWIEDTTKSMVEGFDAPAGAGDTESIWTGTGPDASSYQIMQGYAEKMAAGMPTTPQEDLAYELAYNRAFADKTEIRKDPVTGADVAVTVKASPPPGFPPPRRAAQPAPAPAAQVPGAPPPPGAPAAPATAAAVPGPQPVPAPTGKVITGQPVSGIPPQQMDQADNQNRFRSVLMAAPLGRLIQAGGYDPVTGQVNGNVPTWWDQGLAGNDLTAWASSDAAKGFISDGFKALDPIVRMTTGAALNPTELPRYLNAWLPKSSDPPELRAQKYEDLIAAQAMFENLSSDRRFVQLLTSNDPAAIREASAIYQAAIAQSPNRGRELAGAPNATPAYPAAPTPAAPAAPAQPSAAGGMPDVSTMSEEQLRAIINGP
jgi:hypothetical protein